MSGNQAIVLGESASHILWGVNRVQFHIPRHFVVERTLGAGAYGVVCSAVDVRDGAKVAIKKITHAFDDVRDCKRTLREIKLLRHFALHENVCAVRSVEPFDDDDSWSMIHDDDS
jgi:serine/threonine protein kinase